MSRVSVSILVHNLSVKGSIFDKNGSQGQSKCQLMDLKEYIIPIKKRKCETSS